MSKQNKKKGVTNYDEQTNKTDTKNKRDRYIDFFEDFCAVIFVLRKYAPSEETALNRTEIISHIIDMRKQYDYDDALKRKYYRHLKDLFLNWPIDDSDKAISQDLEVIYYQLGGCIRTVKDRRELKFYFESFIDKRDIDLFNFFIDGEKNKKPSDLTGFRDIRNNENDLEHLKTIQKFLMREKRWIKKDHDVEFDSRMASDLLYYARNINSEKKKTIKNGMFGTYYELLGFMDKEVDIFTEEKGYSIKPTTFRWEKNELLILGKDIYEPYGGKIAIRVKNIVKIRKHVPE